MHPTLRAVGLHFTTGASAILLILVVQGLLFAITGVELKSSISDLGASAGQVLENPFLLIVTFVSMVLSGAIIMGVAVLRTKYAGKFGTKPQKIQWNTQKKLTLVLTLFVVGLLTSVVFGGFNEFIQSASPDKDLNSLNGLISAIFSGNVTLAVAVFFTIAAFGFLAAVVGHLWNPVNTTVARITHDK